MPEEFDIPQLLWLIRQEVATSIEWTDDRTPALKVESVRVRMGQNLNEDNVSSPHLNLSAQRYPLAENGWLIDVQLNRQQTLSAFHTQPPSQNGLKVNSSHSIEVIKGIGAKTVQRLNQSLIHTLQDLIDTQVENITSKQSYLRSMQTLATLGTQPSTIDLNQLPEHLTIKDVLNQTTEVQQKLDTATFQQLYEWGLTLEVCFDSDWLAKHPIHQLISVP